MLYNKHNIILHSNIFVFVLIYYLYFSYKFTIFPPLLLNHWVEINYQRNKRLPLNKMFLVESVSNKHTYIKTDKQLKFNVFVNLIKTDR